MPRRTFQPKSAKTAKRHGFLKRMATAAGRRVLKARRAEGRFSLTPTGKK